MSERDHLNKQYGLTLERILDLHGIEQNRSIVKNWIHNELKRKAGIVSVAKMRNEDLKHYIDLLNDEFPVELNDHERIRNTDHG